MSASSLHAITVEQGIKAGVGGVPSLGLLQLYSELTGL